MIAKAIGKSRACENRRLCDTIAMTNVARGSAICEGSFVRIIGKADRPISPRGTSQPTSPTASANIRNEL